MAGALTKAGRYQIVSELGRGSMGVVYQGYDPLIGRTVAVKTMLTEGLGSQEFQEYKTRFQREAQAAGALTHPNIVTVYDFGEDSGVLYLAMEFLEGKSLEKIVQDQNILPIETILPMYDQVCSALDHAHSHKIVHRDIKPANIMILESGLVKVTDFGIAKMMSLGMTQAGQILGTPNYMSPEQVKGRQVDGRSDIFSLGVILYELVTGEKPFGGQNITTVIYKIINENPTPPRELDATIPQGLNYVIAKALAKNPDERYQTCRELAEDLKNYRNLGGMTAPSATVVIKIPPLQPPPAEAIAQVPIRPETPPPAAPRVAEQAPVRQVSVQVIPPATARPPKHGPAAATWVLLTLLVLGALGGGGYYFFVWNPAHQMGTLIVNSNPAGAKITIDGQSSPDWVTPKTFQKFSPGPHQVLVSKTGYNDSAPNSVTTEAGKTDSINVTLTAQTAPAPAPAPEVGTLVVNSKPAGATITIDGNTQADWLTPKTLPDYAAGDHQVVVAKQGYDDWTGSVTIEAGKTANAEATLKAHVASSPPPPAPKVGTLMISSDPTGAKISIDGRSDASWVTPRTFPDWPAGTYMVTLAKDGYEEVRNSVTVEAGKTKSLSPTLSEPVGEIDITTTPPGLDIFIDGEPAGKSPVQKTLRVGEHTYMVRSGGEEVYRKTFQIKNATVLTSKPDVSGRLGAASGVVTIRTVPSGASVSLDNQLREGITPISFSLSTGHHVVVVALPGSGLPPVKQEFDLTTAGKTLEINLKR